MALTARGTEFGLRSGCGGILLAAPSGMPDGSGRGRGVFGKDRYAPEEFPYYWRTFEAEDEYFDYYRRYHAFWKMYGMELPDDVLRKGYYRNALDVIPGIDRALFPAP